MRDSRNLAALGAALILACGVVAWEWYTHVGGSAAAPQPVQAVTAPATLTPTTPTPQPVTYVPVDPAPTATPVPATAATAAPTIAPSAAPSSTPIAAPPTPTAQPTKPPLDAGATPVPTDVPVEAATIAPAHVAEAPVIRLPPDSPPRILSMSLSTPVAHSGQTVYGTVETSSNVASVVARIGGYATSMKKVGVGKFTLTYTVPKLPFFLHRTFYIQVIARNTKGVAVSSAVPITIR